MSSLRRQPPEIFVNFLPTEYTPERAASLSDNLTSFIDKRGEWIQITNSARVLGKLLRHKKRMSRTEEFHIGDLFITHRLVSLCAEVAENSSRAACRCCYGTTARKPRKPPLGLAK